MTEFLQHVVNGVSLGTIYALIALGYTMVYGVRKLINFAHGDVYMAAAFAGFYIATALDVRDHPTIGKAVVVFLGSMAVAGAMGWAIERFAYRPLRNRPRLATLITPAPAEISALSGPPPAQVIVLMSNAAPPVPYMNGDPGAALRHRQSREHLGFVHDD